MCGISTPADLFPDLGRRPVSECWRNVGSLEILLLCCGREGVTLVLICLRRFFVISGEK